MRSSTDKILDELEANDVTSDDRPWGVMYHVPAPQQNVSIKYLVVVHGARTSRQYHERKDELLIILDDYGAGYVEVGEGDATKLRHLDAGGRLVRIRPGVRHRVVGPMNYIEISTYDDDTDTVRVADDYGRAS